MVDNNTIFNKIIEMLKTIDSLKGSDGTIRVYDYPEPTPDGYPAVSVVYEGEEARVLDSQRDVVSYRYLIRLVQEKMPDYFGPSKGERVLRERVYDITEKFRNNNDLDLSGVLRTIPMRVDKGYIENNTRIVADISLVVETTEEISV